MKPSTKCGRVHFEHSHRKWLVITVRPTTSVRKSPRKNLPSRNTPDSFCRRFTRQNHRCAAWAVFFFYGHLSGRRPLHLAGARPFGRSKAPLGLSLLRNRGILLSEETKNPNPSPIEKRFGFSLFGAMEGTRTPGLLIRRNRMAHFVHFIIRRKIVILIELTLFCRCYSIASFALLALLCTCYPSLRCAENVQKCAEPKSARQDGLKMSDFPAGFLRHQQHKNSQFYPNNNLT